jgi:2-iminobutanoate/2-iminopropanoate deaminase
MPNKKAVAHPEKEFTHGIFSSAVVVDGWVYVSGQGPLEMEHGRFVPGPIAQQTLMTLEHIEKILKQAGASRKDIVSCTVFLADLNDFAEYNKAYGEFFAGSPVMPARTTVGSTLLKGIGVEINAVARLP